MDFRHSLTLKITGIILLVSLLSVILVAAFTRYSTVNAFDKLLLEQSRNDFIDIVTTYYHKNGSWWGANNVLMEQLRSIPRLFTFVLVDVNGQVVISDPHSRVGQYIPASQLLEGIPIEVDGKHVGTLLNPTPPPIRRPEDELYLARTNRALLISAVGAGSLALVLGLLGSRTLTRPLRELTAATEAMAQGDIKQKVPVRTADELGRLTSAFNRMSTDLAHSIQLRRQMTADIAHDLRTPLTVIQGYTEALRDGDLPPSQATFETMYQEAQLLNHLIDDLRTLSLADAGELTLNRRHTSVLEIFSQAQAAYLQQAREADVTINFNFDEPIPYVYVDAERIARVLGNLIGNALRYTLPGGQISLQAHHRENGTSLIVEDTGIGISPEELPHIFNRFYKGDPSRQPNEGESGLGLAIAKSIVEAHGGVITVSSQSGTGTRFEIFLI